MRAQTLSGIGGAQTGHSADASGADGLCRREFCPRVEPKLADLFRVRAARRVGVTDPGAHGQTAACELEMGQTAALGVVADLENPGRKSRGTGCRLGIVLQQSQQPVNAGLAQAGAEAAGEDLPAGNEGRHLFFADGLPVKVLLQQRFPAQGKALCPLAVVFVGKIHTVGTELLQFLQKGLAGAVGKIHFGDEQKRGDMIEFQKTPKSTGVRLYAVGAADNQNGVVQHLQRALHLRRKIHMPRRVQQGRLQRPVGKNGLLGENRNAPLPFQRMVVQTGIAVIHAAGLFQFSGQIEHGLGQGGLSGVHMSQNPDDCFFHGVLHSDRAG